MARTYLEKIQDTIDDLDDESREKLFKYMLDKRFDDESEAKAESEIVPIRDYREEFEEYRRNRGKVVGVRTEDYWEVDNMLGGLAPGELCVLSAVTSGGKSQFCANMTAALVTHGYKVLFITIETDAPQTMDRLDQIMGTEDFYAIMDVDVLRVQKARKVTPKMIRYLIANAKEWGADVVFFDHLHYMAREVENQSSGIGMITQEFKTAAMVNRLPIVLVAQLRKGADEKEEPEPDDLYGSAFISQDADQILLLHRKNYLDTQSNKERTCLIVKIWKTRNRCIWKVKSHASYLLDGLKMVPNAYNPAQDMENRP